MRLQDSYNFTDFRELARRRVPGAIFDYIDGGADDEVSKRRNAAAIEEWDLVPNILRGVGDIDLSVTAKGLGCVETLAPRAACDVMGLQQVFLSAWVHATRHRRAYRAGEGIFSAFGDGFHPIRRV